MAAVLNSDSTKSPIKDVWHKRKGQYWNRQIHEITGDNN